MSSEYDEFTNKFNQCLNSLSNNKQLHVIFDLVFSKCMSLEEKKVGQEDDEELSKYNFDEYLKEIFNKLEQSSPSQLEYNCKCILSILLNHEITPELKQHFFHHIITYLSFMYKKVQEEIQKSQCNLNSTETLSVIMDIYEAGLIDLYPPTRLECGKFLTPIVYKYLKLMDKECHTLSIMDKLLGILNNKTLQWKKYEGAVIGIYNLLLIQEFTDSLLHNDMHLLIGILFSRIISSQQSIRDWCVRAISIIFSKKGNSEELKNLLMETLKHLQPVNWTKISNDTELYSPSTPKTPEDNYFQYNEYNKLPLLLNGSVDFSNYSCTLNCVPSQFDENVNLNSYFGITSDDSNSSNVTGENYAIELEVKKTYPKSDEKQQEKLEKADKPVLSPIQQQSLGLSSGFNSASLSSLVSPSSPAKYSITPVINNCELQFPLNGEKSNIHQIEGLILLLEFLVRYVDSLDVNIFNSVFNISKYYLGHINPNIRQNASSLIKTLVINHHENQEINILFIIHSLAAEWPIRGPLCSTNNTTEDNIPWEWKEGRLFVFEQLFKFLNNQQLHFITPTILKNSQGVSMRPGTSIKDRVLSLSKTNLKHLDTSIDSDLDSTSSQINIGKNTQSLDQLINIEMLKNYDSLMVSNSVNFLHQNMPISHEYDSGNNIKMLENLDISSSTFHSHLHPKNLKIDTGNIQDNCSFYSRIRKRIPLHSAAMPNSPQVSGASSKLAYTQKYNLSTHSMHYGNSQHTMMNSGNNLSMRYKLQSIVRSANTKLNEPMYLKKNLSEFSNLQFHQQIMKILTFIFIQSTFESYNNKQGELKFISKHLIPIITEALLWVDVETSVQLIRDIINGFVDPRSTIIDKSSDSQKYILGMVVKALVVKAITLMELNQKRKDASNGDNNNLSFGSSCNIFGGGNTYDGNSSSNNSDSDEWTYTEKIIDQVKTAIPDIVNFIYCMIDTMDSGPTLTLSCELLMLIRTHFRSNLVAQKSQMKRRFGSNFGLYESESEPCSMRRGLSSTLSYILLFLQDVSSNTSNKDYIDDKNELRKNAGPRFSVEVLDKWKAYVNSTVKFPEDLKVSPLSKKDVINSTAPLWKTFINDLSAYEMLFFMPSLIDFMGESITHQIIFISALNQVFLRWGKLIQTDPTINQLIISKFKSEDAENTWNEDDDFEELAQSDWSDGMDKICLQCIDELNLLVKHKNFTKKTLFLIVNTMYICCLVMNTHLQKDAIKKIFSTLTMLMNEYEHTQKRLSASSTKTADLNCDMDKIFADVLNKTNSSLNFSDMELWENEQETSIAEEADLSLAPVIINDIIKKLDHLSTVLDKRRSNNDVVHCGTGDEKDESNTIHKYFDSLLIDAVKENPSIGNKLNKYLNKTDSQNIPC